MTKAFLAVRREGAWWLGGFVRLLRRHPAGALGLSCTALVLVALGAEVSTVSLAFLVPMVGLASWNRLSPMSFARFVAEPVRRGRIKRELRRRWPSLMEACGLVDVRRVDGEVRRMLPELGRPRWDRHGNCRHL